MPKLKKRSEIEGDGVKAFVRALINSCLDLVAYIIMVANFCIKNQREGVLNDFKVCLHG